MTYNSPVHPQILQTEHHQIYDQWISFAESIGLANAPPIQIAEMQKAFYAGALALLHIVLTKAEPGEEPTDNDMKMMDSIQTELEQFNKYIAAQGTPGK